MRFNLSNKINNKKMTLEEVPDGMSISKAKELILEKIPSEISLAEQAISMYQNIGVPPHIVLPNTLPNISLFVV